MKINYQKIECPICHHTGEYTKTDYETICSCGYVLITPYPYVAGKRINTNIPYSTHKHKKNKKGENKQ